MPKPTLTLGTWVNHPTTGRRGQVAAVYDEVAAPRNEHGRLVLVDYNRTKQNHREAELVPSEDQTSGWIRTETRWIVTKDGQDVCDCPTRSEAHDRMTARARSFPGTYELGQYRFVEDETGTGSLEPVASETFTF